MKVFYNNNNNNNSDNDDNNNNNNNNNDNNNNNIFHTKEGLVLNANSSALSGALEPWFGPSPSGLYSRLNSNNLHDNININNNNNNNNNNNREGEKIDKYYDLKKEIAKLRVPDTRKWYQ